jgi:glycosyltransferase involved in cell wall biosynthesis
MRVALQSLASVRGKQIVLISHDLSYTGSPLLLVETAVKLRQAGANVAIVSLAEDVAKDNPATRNEFELLALADSIEYSTHADLVVANTAATNSWVNNYLEKYPHRGSALMWWIHEIDVAQYADKMHSLDRVAIAVFDSHACQTTWTNSDFKFPPITRVIHPSVDDAFLEEAAKYHCLGDDILKAPSTRNASQSRAAIRGKLGIRPGDFVITLIGSYLSRKGHDLFISTVSRLLREHPALPIKVIIVGFANELEKLQFLNRLDESGRKALDDQRAIETVPNLVPFYAASDAFVMNTQESGECFGRVTIEAMTFKLPVLGTDGGGTPEIVEDGVTGLLHPIGIDGQQRLAKNILTLVENRARAKAMGEAGWKRVQENFTSARFYAEFGSLMETIFH